MPDTELLASVLAHVGELRDRGEDVDVETLVRDHPEIEAPLRRALAAERFLGAAFTDERSQAPPAPAEIGPYRVVARLGSGGMGTVYLAETKAAVAGCEVGTRVALKVLHPHLLERPGLFKRFLREAEAGTRIVDPHVVRTLDADAVRADGDTVHFLVMEYVEGQTLAGLLEELGAVPEALLREIALQMATGLAAIHAAGLVHRDLKPENALITADQRVRIMDLGIARELAAESALTQEGQFAGSLAYAAPEQFGLPRAAGARETIPRSPARAAGDRIDGRADLYALGVTLYELATGANPFRRDDFAGVMAAHREHVPPSVESVVPGTSAFFSDVVQTLLAKKPDERFSSATELALVLADGERSSWWRTREATRPREHRLPQVPVRRETALHGRAEDLALLARAWDAARSGDGRTVLLEGEAGIGKSRLVDAFLQTLPGADVHVLYGSYPPSGRLGGLSGAILDHFGTHGLEESLRPLLTVTPSLVPAFAALVRHEPPPEGAAAMSPDAVHAVLVHLMRALAAEKPLVWIVEDLHFADTESRGYVLSLARAVEGHRVLVLATTRPGAPEDWLAHLARLANFERRPLGRLSAREVMLLLVDAFQSERLAEKLGVRIAMQSDGIPFFVFEMIRGLKEGQFITQTVDGTWVESRVIEKIDVPVAVKDLIAVRLSGLSREEREILDVGSVLGFAFDPDVVAAVLNVPMIAVLRALAHVEQRSGVVRADGRDYRFDHHQLQEVVYAALPPRLREETHAAVADALERRAGAAEKDPKTLDGALCVDLAEHLFAAEQGSRALRYLDAALTHLEKGYRNEQAIALAERALAVPGLLAGAERGRTLLRLAARLDLIGHREPQRAAIEEALGLARATGDRQGEANATRNLGNVFCCLGRYAEARGHFDRCLDRALAIGDRQGEAAATGNLGTVFYNLGRHAEAREVYERHLALAQEIGDRQGEAAATGGLGNVCWSLGRYAEAREHAEQSLALAREIGNRRSEARATGSLGNAFYSLGRHAEAQEHYERYLALAREIGDRKGEATAAGGLGNVFWTLGRHAEGRAQTEQSLALSREIGDRRGEAHATGNLGGAFWSLGRLSESREHHERQLALAREIGDRQSETLATGNLGSSLSSLGRLAEAREHFERHLALAREIGDRREEGYALVSPAEAVSELGGIALVERLLAESLEVRRSTGARGEEAESLLARGALFARVGRRDEARADLEAARAIAHELSLPGVELAASAHLARLPGGDVSAALAALAAHEGCIGMRAAMESRFLLWQATHDRVHLVEAKRRLDFMVQHAPPDCRESMLANVRLHREIAAAARDAGL